MDKRQAVPSEPKISSKTSKILIITPGMAPDPFQGSPAASWLIIFLGNSEFLGKNTPSTHEGE